MNKLIIILALAVLSGCTALPQEQSSLTISDPTLFNGVEQIPAKVYKNQDNQLIVINDNNFAKYTTVVYSLNKAKEHTAMLDKFINLNKPVENGYILGEVVDSKHMLGYMIVLYKVYTEDNEQYLWSGYCSPKKDKCHTMSSNVFHNFNKLNALELKRLLNN